MVSGTSKPGDLGDVYLATSEDRMGFHAAVGEFVPKASCHSCHTRFAKKPLSILLEPQLLALTAMFHILLQ